MRPRQDLQALHGLFNDYGISSSLNLINFRHYSKQADPQYDPMHFAQVRRRVDRFRRSIAMETGSFDSAFCEGESLLALRSCSIASSPGCDGLPYNCFRADETQTVWRDALLLFINIVLASSVLPSAWKIGIAAPLHKAGSRNSFSNYLPISLTSCFCKLFERRFFFSGSHHISMSSLMTVRRASVGALTSTFMC